MTTLFRWLLWPITWPARKIVSIAGVAGSLILLIFSTLAAFCFYVALGVLNHGRPVDVFIAVGESFFIAGLLAFAGDIAMRRKAAHEWVKEAVEAAIAHMFGFLGARQSPELREAVYKLAREPVYLERNRWWLNFQWVDDRKRVLLITLTARVTGECLREGGYLFEQEAWLLESISGYESKFDHYGLYSAQADIEVDENWLSLKDEFCRRERDRLILDQFRLLNAKTEGRKLQSGHKFTGKRIGMMFQHGAGHLPLGHFAFSVDFQINLEGSALPDLCVAVLQPAGEAGGREWLYSANGDLQQSTSHEWRRVPPGQATIVTWYRSNEPAIASQRPTRVSRGRATEAPPEKEYG